MDKFSRVSFASAIPMRTLMTDLAMLTVALLLPTISHLTTFPLYRLNPMLMMVMAARLLGGNCRNAYLLAVLMPLASSLLVGMPSSVKMVCMIAEYLTFLAVFDGLLKRFGSLWSLAGAMLCSKAVYYFLFMLCC